MEQLDGKVAVITGAASGIGRGVARRLARAGASVVIADIDREGGGAARSSIEASGGDAEFVECDVSNREEITAVIGDTVARTGRVDVLVNSAIEFSPDAFLEEKTDEEVARTLVIGFWAAWWSMRACLPTMRDQGGGCVVNMYSIDAEAAAWCRVDYNVTKEAIRGLTRSAAAEWAPYGIRVNAIAPAAKGAVFHRRAGEDPRHEARANDMIPMGRVGDPEVDIAPVVHFLAGDGGRYITGEVIHVDGGLHLSRYSSRPSAGLPGGGPPASAQAPRTSEGKDRR